MTSLKHIMATARVYIQTNKKCLLKDFIIGVHSGLAYHLRGMRGLKKSENSLKIQNKRGSPIKHYLNKGLFT